MVVVERNPDWKKLRPAINGWGIDDTLYVKSKGEYKYINGTRKWVTTWRCPYYQKWINMLRRCYAKDSYYTYENCYVCEDWKYFYNFRSWLVEKNFKHGDVLDKDLLFRGNKKYSAETCCLISHRTNCFILDGASWRGKYKIGVTWHNQNKAFRARCRNPFTGKCETIGYFKDELTAHLAWKNRKLYFAKLLVNEINDDRVKLALIDRYEGDYYAQI